MKFTVKFVKEITMVVDCEDINEAVDITTARMDREQNCKILSIERIIEGTAPAPKNPTPFDRPPSGTPGAGQMRFDSSFAELIARAA